MSVKAVLLDLDGTLVDSSKLDGLRRSRNWKGCVDALDRTTRFEGIADLLSGISASGRKIGIVTTSVSFYAERMCSHHNIRYDTLVAYHDAKPKPHPDPFLKALDRLNVDPRHAVGVGDDLPDAVALRAARIPSIGAGWSPSLSTDAEWDLILRSPAEVLAWLEQSEGKKGK